MKVRIGCVLMAFATLSHAADAVKVIPPQNKVLASENGRYVYGQVSEYRRDQYMLDSKTGRVWRIVYRSFKGADGKDLPGEGYPVLEPIPFLTSSGTEIPEPGDGRAK